MIIKSKSLDFGTLTVQRPYALAVTLADDGKSAVPAESVKAPGVVWLYGSIHKTGAFMSRIPVTGLLASTAVHVLTPEVLIAGAADISNIKGVVKCAHIHDEAVSGMPAGITWTYGLVRKTGRDCPVCSTSLIHGCKGAPNGAANVNRYGKDRVRTDVMGLSCSERDGIFKAERKAAVEAKSAPAKAEAEARVAATVATVKRVRKSAASRKATG